jgi:coproporphyrinogen III oxidase-like Fe-S oxidoreductase
MCDGEVDLDELGARFGIDAGRYFERELAALTHHGELAAVDPALVIHTTATGKLLVRNVCMLFDRYHRDGERGSSTI